MHVRRSSASRSVFWAVLALLLLLEPCLVAASACSQFQAPSNNTSPSSVNTAPSCPPLSDTVGFLSTNNALLDLSIFEDNLLAGIVGKVPVIGVGLSALVYAVWPRGASKQPIYDELACATAQAIDMAVYNEEMGTLRGYLALVNASLTNYIETTQQNGNGCADLTEALQYLSGAAYYMQGLQLAATAKGGAMMPLLLTLSYTHLRTLAEVYYFAPLCGGVTDESATSAILNVYSGYMCAFANFMTAFEQWRPTQCSGNAPSGSLYSVVNDAPSGLTLNIYLTFQDVFWLGTCEAISNDAVSLLYETFLLPVGRLHAVLPFELSSSFRASYVQVETNGTQLVLPPSFNRTLLMGPYSSSQGTTNSPGFNGTQSTLTSVPILSGISSRCNNNTAEFVCSSDNSYTTNPAHTYPTGYQQWTFSSSALSTSDGCTGNYALDMYTFYQGVTAYDAQTPNVDNTQWAMNQCGPFGNNDNNYVRTDFSASGTTPFTWVDLALGVMTNGGNNHDQDMKAAIMGLKGGSSTDSGGSANWIYSCTAGTDCGSVYTTHINMTKGPDYVIYGWNQIGGRTAEPSSGSSGNTGHANASLLGLLVAFWHRMFLEPKPAPPPVPRDSTILPWNWHVKPWGNSLSSSVLASVGSASTIGAGPRIVFDAVFPYRTSLFVTSIPQLSVLVDSSVLAQEVAGSPNPTLYRYLSFVQGAVSLYLSQPLRYSVKNGPCGGSDTPGEVLHRALGACNQTLEYMMSNGQAVQFLPYLVPMAVTHLTLLREQYLYGPTLYGSWTCSQNISTKEWSFVPAAAATRDPSWTTDLVNHFSYYSSLINLLVPQWQQWRFSFITSTLLDNGFTVTDSFTGTLVSSINSPTLVYGDAQSYANGTVTAMRNELNAFLLGMLDPVHSLGALMPLGVIPGGSPYVAQFARPLLQLGPYAPLQGAANSLVLAGYGNSVVWDLPGTPQALYPCYGPGPTFDYLLSYVAPTHNSVLTGGRTSSDCDRVGIFLSTVSGASGVFGVLSGGTNASLVTFSVNQTDNEIATAPGPHNSAPTTQFYARFPAGSFTLVETAKGTLPSSGPNPAVVAARFQHPQAAAAAAVSFAPRVFALGPCQTQYAGECSAILPCCDANWQCLRHAAGQCGNTTTRAESRRCVRPGTSVRTARAAPSAVTLTASCGVAGAASVSITNLTPSLVGSWALSITTTAPGPAPSGCVPVLPNATTYCCFVESIPAGNSVLYTVQLGAAGGTLSASYTGLSANNLVVGSSQSTVVVCDPPSRK